MKMHSVGFARRPRAGGGYDYVDSVRLRRFPERRTHEPGDTQRRASVAGASKDRSVRCVRRVSMGSGAGLKGESVYRRRAGCGLLRVTPPAKQKRSRFDALEIHAIAIDAKDRVYAATAPDGKVIGGTRRQELGVLRPEAEVHLVFAFDTADNLFVATGDQGEIHKVTPDGQRLGVFQER